MNVLSHPEIDAMLLVELVDLKWLLAGEGLHLNVERLKTDAQYACRVLDTAETSKNEALRMVAARLRPKLCVDER